MRKYLYIVLTVMKMCIRDSCNTARDLGVKYLTVYAFSTENWKRSPEEVNGLMNLFRRYLKRCMKQAKKNNMKVTVIGDPVPFDEDIRDSIRELEEFSKDFDAIHFQIALNYGSRDELVRAANRMAADIRSGRAPEVITEQDFEKYLDTAGVPDPDLMIRTSGELRLSLIHI